MRCLAEVGYSQASIREIARAAGMTSGSLYHYFPTKSDLLEATSTEIEAIVLTRLRAAAARSEDVIDRLDAVLDESKHLMRDFPHLAAFLRATRVQSATRSWRGGYPGSRALREVVSEIVEEARRRGILSADTGEGPAVETICALTRGLSEQAARLPRRDYDAALDAVKRLIRGTLFGRTPTD